MCDSVTVTFVNGPVWLSLTPSTADVSLTSLNARRHAQSHLVGECAHIDVVDKC
jgi:hypothetical protein